MNKECPISAAACAEKISPRKAVTFLNCLSVAPIIPKKRGSEHTLFCFFVHHFCCFQQDCYIFRILFIEIAILFTVFVIYFFMQGLAFGYSLSVFCLFFLAFIHYTQKSTCNFLQYSNSAVSFYPSAETKLRCTDRKTRQQKCPLPPLEHRR